MNTSAANIFLSIVCNVFLMTDNIFVKGYNCFYNTTETRSVHCKHSVFDDVPQDLDVRIEEINFDNDTFVQMDNKSFIKYVNLTTIRIRNSSYINKTNPIHHNTFENVKKLKHLSIENIYAKFNASFLLPPTLKTISLSRNTFIEDVNLTSAYSLREFHAYECSLRSFPQFNESAPLTTIDVRWNPLDYWTAEDLAPFCLLQSIHVEWAENAGLTHPARFCQCTRLNTWIKTYTTDRYSLNCTLGENNKEEICNTTFSERTLNKRRKCLDRYSKSDDQPLAFILLASLFTIPASTIGYLHMKINKLIQKKEGKHEDSSAKHDTHTSKGTRAPEKSERGGEAEPKSRKEEEEKENKERKSSESEYDDEYEEEEEDEDYE